MDNQTNQITWDEQVAVTNIADRDIDFDFFDEKTDPRTNKTVNVATRVTYKAGETKFMLGGIGGIHAKELANQMLVEHENERFSWDREKRDRLALSMIQRAGDVLAKMNAGQEVNSTVPPAVNGNVANAVEAPVITIPTVDTTADIQAIVDAPIAPAAPEVETPSTTTDATDGSGQRPEFE